MGQEYQNNYELLHRDNAGYPHGKIQEKSYNILLKYVLSEEKIQENSYNILLKYILKKSQNYLNFLVSEVLYSPC